MPSMTQTLDAPTMGWNAFDSLDNMPPTAAVILDNLIPGAGSVRTRQGYVEYVDLGTGSPCESVMELYSSDNKALLAASGGGMWDITDPYAVVELAPTLTFSNNQWNERNFRRADEAGILLLCNGTDNTQVYNPLPTPAISDLVDTDVVGTDFIGAEVFKGRVYYWKDNDDSFYYTAAGAYQGSLTRFPLGAQVQRGGKIVHVVTWTQSDSGDGKDDFIVFVFDTGEILIYQGDDPGGVGYFEMVGRFKGAKPLSARGRAKYGNDRILMTDSGYVGLDSVVQVGRTSDVSQFSRMIHSAIIEQVAETSSLYGWDCVLFAKQGLMIFNVPITADTFQQHVLNTVTQTWCRFTGINVNCLNVFGSRLFGGTNDGRVIAMLEGSSDNGMPIAFTCLYAFNQLGDGGTQKHLTAAQVLTTHSAPEYIQLSGYADFDVPTLTPVTLPPTLSQGAWSINPENPPSLVGSYWDEDYWSREGSKITYKGWQNVSAFGYSVALLVRFAKLNDGVEWRSTNIRFSKAGAQ